MTSLPCPGCGVPWPSSQTFCGNCGGKLPGAELFSARRSLVELLAARARSLAPPPSAMSWPLPVTPDPSGMRICAGCGVIAPTKVARCKVCDHTLGEEARLPPAPPAKHALVVVRCSFTCRGCGLAAPLDFLDVDGEAECVRCGLNQAFAKDVWEDALAHAHDVADLSGPAPEGRLGRRPIGESPHASIGISHTFAEYTDSSVQVGSAGLQQRSIKLVASPGHPLCSRCQVPLLLEPKPLRELATSCPACGASARYRLPAQAQALCAGLKGIIAAEHRVDRKEVGTAESAGGAVAILCPMCSAALPAATSEIVTCPFCATSARVPQRLLRRLGTKAVQPRPFWLLFTGPAPSREKLERDAIRHEKAAKKQDEKARKRAEEEALALARREAEAKALAAQQTSASPRPAAPASPAPAAAEAAAAVAPAPAPRRRRRWPIVVALLGLLLAGSGAALVVWVVAQRTTSEQKRPPTVVPRQQPRRR